MNFILPLRAAWMRMGTSWGSLGPNIPWGRIAVVRKLLSGSFALSTSCRERGEENQEGKLSTAPQDHLWRGWELPISLGRNQWKNYCPLLSFQVILPLFPSPSPALLDKKNQTNPSFYGWALNELTREGKALLLSFNTSEARGALQAPSLQGAKEDTQEFHFHPSQGHSHPSPPGSASGGVIPSPWSSSSTFSSSGADSILLGAPKQRALLISSSWSFYGWGTDKTLSVLPKTKPQSPALGPPLIAAPQLPLSQLLQSAAEGTDVFTIKFN